MLAIDADSLEAVPKARSAAFSFGGTKDFIAGGRERVDPMQVLPGVSENPVYQKATRFCQK